MLSEKEICDVYVIDEDYVGRIEDTQFLLEVGLFANPDHFDSTEKLHETHCKLVSISHRILDGTCSDALCDLLDNTFYEFRQRRALIERIVEKATNQLQRPQSAANNPLIASSVSSNVIDFNQVVSLLKVKFDAVERANATKFPNLSHMPPSPDFASLTVVEQARQLLHASEIITYVESRSDHVEAKN